MNDEIREILDYLKNDDYSPVFVDEGCDDTPYKLFDEIEVKLLLDYITNLQKEIQKKEAMYDSLAVDYRLAQEENERLKIKCDFLVGKKLAEIDKNAKQIKIKAIEHEDYKSKVEKAINNCKKSIEAINTKLENNKEPFEVVDGKIIYLNDYQVARLKAIRMKCKELLNILQNGSDTSVKD